MPLCTKQYSASNSGLGLFNIGLLISGSSLLEKLLASGSSSGIGISSLGRLVVLLVDGIQLVGITGLPIGVQLVGIGVSNF